MAIKTTAPSTRTAGLTKSGTRGRRPFGALANRALRTEGLLGWLYWYSLYPVHAVMFSHMIRNLIEAAESGQPPWTSTRHEALPLRRLQSRRVPVPPGMSRRLARTCPTSE